MTRPVTSPRIRRGLSLLELLVVVSILAVLATMTTCAAMQVHTAGLRAERANWHHQRRLGETTPRRLPIKVLFIGNSYTSANDLPGVVEALATAKGTQPPLVVDSHTPGGARLKDHWEGGDALAKVQSQSWDFVVLQEQSQTPLRHFGRDAFFYPYARRWNGTIRERGAIPLFYMTWKRPDTPGVQDDWTRSYVEITKELQAEVAPAGMAWEKAQARLPRLVMYADTGGHPTPAATYLVACVFYAAVYDKTPVGLPASVETKGGTRVGVTDTEAKVLQECAWEALTEVKPKVVPRWRQ